MTFGAQAQSAEFKASVRKLMAVSGSDATLKMIPEQILSMIEQQAPALPESVKVEIQAMFSEEALLSLMDRMVPIYAKYYTLSTIRRWVRSCRPFSLRLRSKACP